MDADLEHRVQQALSIHPSDTAALPKGLSQWVGTVRRGHIDKADIEARQQAQVLLSTPPHMSRAESGKIGFNCHLSFVYTYLLVSCVFFSKKFVPVVRKRGMYIECSSHDLTLYFLVVV